MGPGPGSHFQGWCFCLPFAGEGEVEKANAAWPSTFFWIDLATPSRVCHQSICVSHRCRPWKNSSKSDTESPEGKTHGNKGNEHWPPWLIQALSMAKTPTTTQGSGQCCSCSWPQEGLLSKHTWRLVTGGKSSIPKKVVFIYKAEKKYPKARAKCQYNQFLFISLLQKEITIVLVVFVHRMCGPQVSLPNFVLKKKNKTHHTLLGEQDR